MKINPMAARTTSLRVVGWRNGAGIERNLRIVREVAESIQIAIESGEYAADGPWGRFSGWIERLKPRYDLQLSLEHLGHRLLAGARVTWLVPNPEWFEPTWVELIPRVDRFLVKSLHAQRIFEERGARDVRFVGWTTIDKHDPAVDEHDWMQPLHVAGRSRQKGTRELLDVWRRRPDFPTLTVIAREGVQDPGLSNVRFLSERIADAELKRLMNVHRLHLCPSNAEGFGHTIGEALSTGAIVLTTDAAPMNELVDDSHGLRIPVRRTRAMGLDAWYDLESDALEYGVERLLNLPVTQREVQSHVARQVWEERDRAFRGRLARQLLDAATLSRQ